MDIRPAVPDDAEAVTAVHRETFPYLVKSAAAMRHLIANRTPVERFLGLVATSEGSVVGWGSTALNPWTSEPGQCYLTVYVHPEHRQRGIGGALSDRLHEHLREIGAVRVRVFAEPDAVEFAKRRGYDGSRLMHYAGVDPRVLPPEPEVPEGFRIVPINELDPRQLYTADTLASLDEPGDSPIDAIDYDEWVREIWEAPAQDLAIGTAALIGDEVASFSAVEVDGDRAWSAMTGTIAQYRGLGLAKLVKSVALRRAAAAGITGAFTSNDDENGPMLAINNWLGYRRVQTRTGLLRLL